MDSLLPYQGRVYVSVVRWSTTSDSVQTYSPCSLHSLYIALASCLPWYKLQSTLVPEQLYTQYFHTADADSL